MFEDKNTYITETGALMSANDYSFLSTDQQSKCKVYKMETNNKPDFEKMAREYAETFKTGEWFENIRTDAGKVIGEKIWNDYVIPERASSEKLVDALLSKLDKRDAKIAELEEVERLYITKCRLFAELESENQALKSELDELNNSETDIAKELFRVKSELDKANQELELWRGQSQHP